MSGRLQGQVPEWITQALSPSLDNSVVFLETGTTEIKLCVNQVEADIVRQLLSALKEVSLFYYICKVLCSIVAC